MRLRDVFAGESLACMSLMIVLYTLGRPCTIAVTEMILQWLKELYDAMNVLCGGISLSGLRSKKGKI
jgi:hypothetical protein